MSDRYEINGAFVRIFNSLIESKTIKSKGELATILNIKPSTLSEIIAKRQGVTVEFIQKFCSAFPTITPNDFSM
ncbi:helix-turn-helix transcriptional regulator [Dyadobacter sp. CY323]|uniref:helix-turn-helix domain-containing protein n=1 Tax=Dyadobacter sp. CY323 TaxID=2907302 RepID=UPI001F225D4A|nr:helix-turn-helix transcriptional regulator [Dyadobacter sp. CY323]MCE6990303.1 helix-turn-helix transcriptional regulator [Dyadobacter sp. CY323]